MQDEASMLIMQADNRFVAGDTAAACEIINRAHLISSGWKAKTHWALFLLRQKEYAAAIKLLDEALALTPPQEKRAMINWLDIRNDAMLIMHLRMRMTAGTGPVLRDDQSKPRDMWETTAVADIAAQLEDGAPGQMDIVFFHVAWKGQHPFLKADDAVDYRKILIAACTAAHRASPTARIVILTDKTSELAELPDWVHLVRVDVLAQEMMFSRLRAYRALSLSRRLKGPVLFLDTDICLNRDFAPLLNGAFDIGLTYRVDTWHMPLNEGVIIALNAERAAAFFDMDLDIYEWIASHEFVAQRYGFNVKMWRGGQLSLGALIDWNFPPAAPADLVMGGVRCRMLPCDDFNYNVKITDDPAKLATKWAVHFKGAQTKKLMTP